MLAALSRSPGIPESVYAAGRTGKRTHPRRGHRDPDLRRLSRIQSTLPHPSDGRLLLWEQRHVPRRAAAGIEKTGDDFPAQGLQVAPEKGQDHGRDGADAFRMEAFRLQCLLWNRISPKDDAAMENLARYIIRASSRRNA